MMKELLQKGFWYWRLVIFKASNGWFIAVAAAFLGFTDGEEWKTPEIRLIRLVLFCLVAGAKYLDGFFDQTISATEPKKQEQKPT